MTSPTIGTAARASAQALIIALDIDPDAPLIGGEPLSHRVVGATELGTWDREGTALWIHRLRPDVRLSRRVKGSGPGLSRQIAWRASALLAACAPGGPRQIEIAGWALAVLDRIPVLNDGVLSTASTKMLPAATSASVVVDEISDGDLLALWRNGTANPYQLSIPVVLSGILVIDNEESPPIA